jgi:hypothetical protein
MDRLAPILKQKFWILLGVSLVTILVGWWMSTATLATTITARLADIDKASKRLSPGDVPSKDYAEKLSLINIEQEKQVDAAVDHLWTFQKSRMSWPANLAKFANAAGYRGEFDPLARDLHRQSFPRAVKKTWQTINPFDPESGTGMVDFPLSKMPVRYWTGDIPPSSQEMWDAQEDLWLLESIFETISHLNGGKQATSRLDASIHMLQSIKLMGGQRGTGGAVEANPMAMMAGGPMAMMAGPMAAVGQGGPVARGAESAEFNPRDEFGEGGEAAAGGGGGASPGGPAMAAMMMRGANGGMADAGESSEPTVRRYIDDEEAMPFRTRGFYMVLLMDHRKLPDFLTELSSNPRSPWPIEIVRVQVAIRNDDSTSSGAAMGGLGFPGLGGAGGYPSGGPPGGGFAAGPGFGDPNGGSGPPPVFEEGTQRDDPLTNKEQMAISAARLAMQNALQDPAVSTIAISGLFTIYRQPEAEKKAFEEAQKAAAESAANQAAATTEAAAADEEAMSEEAPTEEAETDPSNMEAAPADGEAEEAPPANATEGVESPDGTESAQPAENPTDEEGGKEAAEPSSPPKPAEGTPSPTSE